MKPSIANLGPLLLRVFFGGGMLFGHGWGKLVNFAALADTFPDPLGVGAKFSLGLTVFAEFFCAGFVLLGILTRWSLVPLIVTMLVAVLMIHGGDPFATKEKAVLYLGGFAVLWLLGPGGLSVDRIFLKKSGA